MPQESLRNVGEPEALDADTPLRGLAWDWGSVQALRGVAVGPLEFHPTLHCIVQWPELPKGSGWKEEGTGSGWKEEGTRAANAQLTGYACAHM